MKLKHVPNAICFLRIAMVGVLWVVALGHHRILFIALVVFTFLTDVVDGYLARKYHLESRMGAKLDTIADNSVAISLPAWVYILRPELFRDYWPLIALLVIGFVASIVLQYARYGRRVPLHLYSNKISSWALGLFLLHAFLCEPNPLFAYVTVAVVGCSLVEEIVLVATRDDLDENVRSMFVRPARQAES